MWGIPIPTKAYTVFFPFQWALGTISVKSRRECLRRATAFYIFSLATAAPLPDFSHYDLLGSWFIYTRLGAPELRTTGTVDRFLYIFVLYSV